MIYLDNSATTKQYPEVTRLMIDYMDESFGNPSSLYQLGVDSEKAIKTARRQVEKAMGVGAEGGRLYFTSGGTEADNMAVFGAVRAMKRYGSKVVTTKVEHPAVLECCRRLESEGFEVVYVGVDEKCRLDEEQLADSIDEKTILVTIMHVNNEVGTVMPAGRIKQIMKEKKSPGLFHCDAVQSFGKISLPKDADMISVSSHKIHGPKGAGALYVKKDVNIPAFIEGGGQERGMRSGTENVPAIAGFGLAAEMSCENIGTDLDRMERIRDRFLNGFKNNIDDIIINSPEETGEKPGSCCGSVLNVSFLGTRGEVLLHTLEQDGIFVSTGSACSSNKKGQSHVLKAMGLKDKEIEGTLRFSIGRFNSEKEADTVIEKVCDAVKRFRKLGSFR